MKVTNVKVKVYDENPESKVKAMAQVTFDECFVVHRLRVIMGKEDKLFVAMPSMKMANGEYKDIAHPINAETRKLIEEPVLKEYEVARKKKEEDAASEKDKK